MANSAIKRPEISPDGEPLWISQDNYREYLCNSQLQNEVARKNPEQPFFDYLDECQDSFDALTIEGENINDAFRRLS